jgi:hypothetical protein
MVDLYFNPNAASERTLVNADERAAALAKHSKAPIIYHAFNVSIISAGLQIYIASDNVNQSGLVMMLRYGKVPTLSVCDFFTVVSSLSYSDQGDF